MPYPGASTKELNYPFHLINRKILIFTRLYRVLGWHRQLLTAMMLLKKGFGVNPMKTFWHTLTGKVRLQTIMQEINTIFPIPRVEQGNGTMLRGTISGKSFVKRKLMVSFELFSNFTYKSFVCNKHFKGLHLLSMSLLWTAQSS